MGINIPLITLIGNSPLKIKIKWPVPTFCHFRYFRLEVVCFYLLKKEMKYFGSKIAKIECKSNCLIMACENFWSLALGQPQWGNLSLRNTSLIGQPPRKYIFCFSLLSPPPIPSPILEVKVTKFQLPLNRKVWHTWFRYAFFPLYSFAVSFIISFYLFLSSIWEGLRRLLMSRDWEELTHLSG